MRKIQADHKAYYKNKIFLRIKRISENTEMGIHRAAIKLVATYVPYKETPRHAINI